jgi:hypothetical protein
MFDKKNGNILTRNAGTVGHMTAVAVPNTKYPYHESLVPYLNQLLSDLT